MEKSFDTILLLGLSHHNAVRGAAISAHGMFRTTLGNIGLNEDFVIRRMAKNGNVRHLPAAHADEHSPQNLPRLSESFVQAVGKQRVFLIGRIDPRHYVAYAGAIQSDGVLIETISRFHADVLQV